MAKRRRREVSTPTPSLTVRLSPSARPLVAPSPSRTILQDIEDRRTFHPLGNARPARFSTGGPSHLTTKDRPAHDRFAGIRKFNSGTKAAVVFAAPDNVAICVRRKSRREVLFAKRRAGKGGARRRAPRRNWFSAIKC